MKLLFILTTVLLSSYSYAYTPLWEKSCRKEMKKKTDLYEIYNDCLEVCMPASSLHRKKTIKDKVRVCTLFTARFHNVSYDSKGGSDIGSFLRKGLSFCHEQKKHNTGGHWLAISRKCKRIICEYNPKVSTEENKECKDIYKYLHNGKVETVPMPSSESEKQRKKPEK